MQKIIHSGVLIQRELPLCEDFIRKSKTGALRRKSDMMSVVKLQSGISLYLFELLLVYYSLDFGTGNRFSK